MDQVLRYLSNKSEPRFQRQIKYILSHLEEDDKDQNEGEDEGEEDKSSDGSDDDMDDLDMMGDDDQYNSDGEGDYDDYDEEEDELVDIAGAEMLPKGERWLMQEFLANNEEAQNQNLVIEKRVEEYNQEKKKLMEAYQKKRMEGSMHTQDDTGDEEKPHMRPLTPNKFASSNNNTSVFEPDSSNRNLPSELRSRPKIQRTPPHGGDPSDMSPVSRNNTSIGSPAKSVKTDLNADVPSDTTAVNGIFKDHNEEVKIVPQDQESVTEVEKRKQEQEQKLKDPEKVEELQQAFKSEDKLRRTPPKEAKMRYIREKKKKMMKNPNLYS